MARSNSKDQERSGIILADGEELDLRNRTVAAVLAWLLPGAGHYYQRRYFKAGIFASCVLSSFLIGLLLSGGKCVYAAINDTEWRWQYLLQVGVGVPTLPAALQYMNERKGEPPFWNGFMAAPANNQVIDDWHKETASGFDLGLMYTMVAGLLNFLVIFDAYAGPLPPPAPKKKKERRKREAAGDESDAEAATGTQNGVTGHPESPATQRVRASNRGLAPGG